jgi:hypothetical protein
MCSSSDIITEIENRGEIYDIVGCLRATIAALQLLVKETRKKEDTLKTQI